MFDLSGRVALVTGGRRGMGKADAKKLAQAGAKVVVTDINEEECQQVVEEIEADGGQARAYAMDVTDKERIDEVISEVVQEWSRLDILVNNAGIFDPVAIGDLSEEQWEKTIDINLKGQFLCAQRAAEAMQKNGWGRIINISSIASGEEGVGFPGATHYSASKGGVKGMTETLALELGGEGITVNSIAPGAIDTPMIADQDMEETVNNIPLGRVGKPEEIANAVLFMASEEASYVTGAVLYVDGGWMSQ